MTDSHPPAILLFDDPRHGVALLARQIAEATAARDAVSTLELRDAEEHPSVPDRVHAHFTDRLWAGTPEDAAARFEALAARTRLTVTLHDIPQPSDGERNRVRRTAAYRRVVDASVGVVVNSRHEAALLEEAGIVADPTVIPLPVDMHPGRVDPEDLDGSAAVLGFFYPGKGHAEVAEALADLRAAGARDPLRLLSLGGISPGHEGEMADLIADAVAGGVEVEVTGYLDDHDLLARCRVVSVPVVAHRHFSASGSLGSWISAGRRPLVVDSRYVREMAELRPGTLAIVEEGPSSLASAIAAALADPATTVLPADLDLGPGLADIGRAYLDWWRMPIRDASAAR